MMGQEMTRGCESPFTAGGVSAGRKTIQNATMSAHLYRSPLSQKLPASHPFPSSMNLVVYCRDPVTRRTVWEQGIHFMGTVPPFPRSSSSKMFQSKAKMR